MKRKNFVKFTAVATAAVMAISPSVVFAEDSTDGATTAESTIQGDGSLEDYVNKDVFKVTLPTIAAGDADFTLDPQGLLNIADSSSYGVGAGAIYFKKKPTTEGGAVTYSSVSDPIEIINKSSYDIDVAFSVKVELPTGVVMVEKEEDLANATTPSIYLAMREAGDAANTATALKAGDNTAAVKKVDKVPEGDAGYKIKATPKDGGGYTYAFALVDNYDVSTAKKASYTLTGKCDTKADWSAVNALEGDAKNVKTTIVWSAKKHEDFTDGGSAHGNWGTDGLWLAKDASTGFTNSSLTVEVSEDEAAYTALTSSQYTVSDANWVCVTWDGIVAGLGSEPAGSYYVRITDGTTRYTYQQQ